ncbi:hypothetical protein [uncultured Megasphaera sp.]|uniref:hypothetical protein n=1 Tax=uncultured Megasphaera sp. TaxID=165188 RepID=UPI00266C0FB5|nr:hypothetical protein [uncultured Megasphaera sp.]
MSSKDFSSSAFLAALSTMTAGIISVLSLLPALFLTLLFATLVIWIGCALLFPTAYVIPVTAFIVVLLLIGSVLYAWYDTKY